MKSQNHGFGNQNSEIDKRNLAVIMQNRREEEQLRETRNPQRFIKYLVMVMILVVIAGIYVIKNRGQEDIAAVENLPEYALDATEDFDMDKILSYGLPVIIDFGSDTCKPCKEMIPILKELNEELRGKAIVKLVDLNKNPLAARGIPLKVIPTQFFFTKDGKPYAPKEGGNIAFRKYTDKGTKEHTYTFHEGFLDKASIMAALKEMGVE